MEQITTICYGKMDTWQSREEAQAFFLKAMAGSEGSEQERYATIYTQLCLGMIECMFDTNMVQVIADEMKFYELVIFIEEHKGDYAKFILTGEC